jgi:hypothetical protein
MAHRLLSAGDVATWRLAVILGGLLLPACGPSSGAILQPVDARTAVVGVELDLTLQVLGARDATFGYLSDLGDLATRPLKPTLDVFDGGQAVFRWTPIASDVGDHTLRFTAAAGGTVSAIDVPVTVVAGADPLRFIEPAGDGTTLDLAAHACADVALLVDDPSATDVTLAQGDAWSDGGQLMADGPLSGKLHFCPTAAQAQAGTIFPFSFVATDASGARVEKRYTVVLGALQTPPPPPPPPTPPVCDTTTPSITHKPHPNYTGTGNLHLYATVADPNGVAGATAYWSTDPPLDPANPDFTQMFALPMSSTGGTLAQTDFAATIDSPVAGFPSGYEVTIYYAIVATDDADQVAGCTANVGQVPASGLYSFVVKAP